MSASAERPGLFGDHPPKGFTATGAWRKGVALAVELAGIPGGRDGSRHTGLSGRVFAEDMSTKLKLSFDVCWGAVRETLVGEPGPAVDKSYRLRLALRIMAARDMPGRDRWDEKDQIWLRFVCLDITPCERCRPGKQASILTVLVVNGPLAGDEIQIRKSNKMLRQMLNLLGMPKWDREVPISPTEIVGMRGWMRYGADRSGTLGISSADAQGIDRSHNKKLHRDRSGDHCRKPEPCCMCPKGTDQCALACRRKSKVYGKDREHIVQEEGRQKVLQPERGPEQHNADNAQVGGKPGNGPAPRQGG